MGNDPSVTGYILELKAAHRAELDTLRQRCDDTDIVFRGIEATLGVLDHSAAIDDESALAEHVSSKVAKLVTAHRDLRQRCEALEAALNGSYPFVKGFHWLTPHDEPTYTQRKDTLKAIEELLKPDAAISAQPHAQGNGGKD